MPPQTLLLYLASSTLLTLSPGPDILTVLTRSITQGTRAGLVAALGFASGLLFHTTAAALGLGLLLQQSPSAFTILKMAGALYLLYLAYKIATDHTSFLPSADAPHRPLARIYLQSILMNILNPKVTLFFLAFLPQFIAPSQSTFPQFLLLGALFALTTIAVFSSIALLAGPLSAALRKRPTLTKPLQYATALLFLLLAVRLACT